jgi:hypothetical protein
MWCKICRQDVPALRSGERQTLCCPRCGKALGTDSDTMADTATPSGKLSDYDGWELDEQLAHIQRVLHSGSLTGHGRSTTDRREMARFDPPQAGLPTHHAPRNRPGKKRKSSRRRSISAFFTWSVISFGAMSLVCGGALLIWSLVTGRQELWNVGLPPALVGQIALLVGLVLQIDRLWYDSRQAAAKLDDVDQQVHDLTTTTMLLGANQGPASATFYSHLAGGAGPQLLLTDLKSQLDLLAMKLAQEE